MSEEEIQGKKEVERYITAIVDTIFEAAPKGDVDNVGMLPMLDMELVLLALVAVHACGLAHTDSLSGTPKALKRSVEDYADAAPVDQGDARARGGQPIRGPLRQDKHDALYRGHSAVDTGRPSLCISQMLRSPRTATSHRAKGSAPHSLMCDDFALFGAVRSYTGSNRFPARTRLLQECRHLQRELSF
jgi:hypothetical protein